MNAAIVLTKNLHNQLVFSTSQLSTDQIKALEAFTLYYRGTIVITYDPAPMRPSKILIHSMTVYNNRETMIPSLPENYYETMHNDGVGDYLEI